MPFALLASGLVAVAPLRAAPGPALPTASDAAASRPVPDYDGRPGKPEPDAAWLGVPRIVLAPLYLVSEFVIRRPLAFVMNAGEHEVLGTQPIDDERGVSPTGRLDLGFRPSLGLYAFYDSVWRGRDELRLHATTWGPDWFSVAAVERVRLSDSQWIGVRGELTHRDDWVFHGLGPESRQADLGRYTATFVEGRLQHETRTADRLAELRTRVGVRSTRFDPAGACCGDFALSERVAQNRYPLPPSISDGYTVLVSRLDLALDGRGERLPPNLPFGSDFSPPPATGAGLRAGGELATSLDARPVFANGPDRRLQWIRYGASSSASLDLTGDQRVVELSVEAEFARPLTGGEVPFTEQPSLGGERLVGFLPGRLIGRSLALAGFRYTWPVWISLDGVLSFEVGNAFGTDLDGFSLERLRSSFGAGVRSIGRPDQHFELLVGFGGETFAAGGEPENLRFVFGWARGF